MSSLATLSIFLTIAIEYWRVIRQRIKNRRIYQRGKLRCLSCGVGLYDGMVYPILEETIKKELIKKGLLYVV